MIYYNYNKINFPWEEYNKKFFEDEIKDTMINAPAVGDPQVFGLYNLFGILCEKMQPQEAMFMIKMFVEHMQKYYGIST